MLVHDMLRVSGFVFLAVLHNGSAQEACTDDGGCPSQCCKTDDTCLELGLTPNAPGTAATERCECEDFLWDSVSGLCAECLEDSQCDMYAGEVCCPNTLTCETGDATTACAECLEDSQCDMYAGEVCCPSTLTCETGDAITACGDPHMTGFHGQKFDFTGKDGDWYALISDLPSMHLNMRVTSPVPSLPEITYITGLSLITTDADGFDHSVVISVKDPHSTKCACSVDHSPCLADGSLSVILDGEEGLLSPGTVELAPGVQVTAVNIPGECRSFGFETYWEKKKVESAQGGRKLTETLSIGDWVLADPTLTNLVECTEYVAGAMTKKDQTSGLFAHQSEHASFQIVTPMATIRLSHGRLHQIATRDPTDQFDLPDHLTWQMNMAIDHIDVSRDVQGIIGETFKPTLDANGNAIMHGMESIRGEQDDYFVEGPLGVEFAQNAYKL